MSEEFVEDNFLGLPDLGGDPDVVILQIPYELTTSYGQGIALGPAACVAASGQVELFDRLIGEDLPAGYKNLHCSAVGWRREQSKTAVGKHFAIFSKMD